MTNIDYGARVKSAGLNVYTVCEADAGGNIRTENIIPANPTFNCYSIAKAFATLAVGICRDRGMIDTDTKICDILGKYFPKDIDEKWYRVTLHDLLTHKIGYGSGLLDIDAEDASSWQTHDYLSIALGAPLSYEPGEKYQYTDAAFYLVSRVISELTGKRLSDFLLPIVFDVMNFAEFSWSVCPHGHSMGATGLYLRTSDLVKLGVLYLRGGDWFGTRVVSRDWTDTVTDRGYEFTQKAPGWYGKGGMRGQMLAFNREKGIAVAWNAYGSVPFDKIVYAFD